MSDQLTSDLLSLRIEHAAPKQRRRGPWLAVTLGVGVLGYVGYAYGVPYVESELLTPEVAVGEIGVLSPTQASVELAASGYVVPQVITRVGAKVAGRVVRVHVDEGDHVNAGDPLIELEQADREAAIDAERAQARAAEARLATSRASLAEAELQANRQRRLAENGVAPRADADDLEARAASLAQASRAAAAEVKSARAQIAALQVDLRYMSVAAPISGTVINKPPEVGEVIGVAAGAVSSDKFVELADFSTLQVEADIPEARLHMAKIGSPCEITLDAFPGRRYRGEAVQIGARVNRAKATVEVKVKFVDDMSGVLPDMSARVSFLSTAIEEAALTAKPKLVLPASALVTRGNARAVFVLEGEVAAMRAVRVGEPLGGGYELLEGPAAGTRVVTSPPPALKDGQHVKEKH